jgi:uncharacterized YigZ family protein
VHEVITLAGRGRCEIDKIQGSRFIASAGPVSSAQEIEAFLSEVRREFHAARHHGFAWRLGDQGESFRAADDGEPAGSTGRPILERIVSRGLTNCLVVVTRYFGGTKLGVGGLVRAYGAAAEAVLESLPPLTVVRVTTLIIEHDWELTGVVEDLLARRGLSPTRGERDAGVRLEVAIPEGELEAFKEELRERTAARARVTEIE